MKDTHLVNHIENNPTQEMIKFPSRKGFLSFAQAHQQGLIKEGMEIMLERNYRTELIPATLVKFIIVPVANDYTGIGKYMNAQSFASVKFKGVEDGWPLTMIYIKP